MSHFGAPGQQQQLKQCAAELHRWYSRRTGLVRNSQSAVYPPKECICCPASFVLMVADRCANCNLRHSPLHANNTRKSSELSCDNTARAAHMLQEYSLATQATPGLCQTQDSIRSAWRMGSVVSQDSLHQLSFSLTLLLLLLAVPAVTAWHRGHARCSLRDHPSSSPGGRWCSSPALAVQLWQMSTIRATVDK